MNTSQLVIMLALFTLRCLVPIILMCAIAYATNRLVDHWETTERPK